MALLAKNTLSTLNPGITKKQQQQTKQKNTVNYIPSLREKTLTDMRTCHK